jgi:hypothetical protein
MKYQHMREVCLHAGFTQMKIIKRDLLMKYLHTKKLYLHAGHTQMKIIIRDLR